MDQGTLNIIFGLAMALMGVICALLGWWGRTMWESLNDLRKADEKLVDRVAAIEILVAGQYIRKDEFERMVDAMFHKLDKISDKLDGKADKK